MGRKENVLLSSALLVAVDARQKELDGRLNPIYRTAPNIIVLRAMMASNGTERGLTTWTDGPAKLPVKVYTLGRLHSTKEQRREVLAAFAKSGESLPRFARRVGLKYSF
jgi:hypothetical protein